MQGSLTGAVWVPGAVLVLCFVDKQSHSFPVPLYLFAFTSSKGILFSLNFGMGSEGGSLPLISVK